IDRAVGRDGDIERLEAHLRCETADLLAIRVRPNLRPRRAGERRDQTVGRDSTDGKRPEAIRDVNRAIGRNADTGREHVDFGRNALERASLDFWLVAIAVPAGDVPDHAVGIDREDAVELRRDIHRAVGPDVESVRALEPRRYGRPRNTAIGERIGTIAERAPGTGARDVMHRAVRVDAIDPRLVASQEVHGAVRADREIDDVAELRLERGLRVWSRRRLPARRTREAPYDRLLRVEPSPRTVAAIQRAGLRIVDVMRIEPPAAYRVLLRMERTQPELIALPQHDRLRCPRRDRLIALACPGPARLELRR